MLRSSIAKKAVVALTGLVWLGYVLGHLLGNLQIFLGRETINRYAEFLHSMPELLWAVRLVLIVSLVLHVYYTIKLARENRAARPLRYVREGTVRASPASRTMVLSGLLVLAFIVYHILHFTALVTNPEYRDFHEPIGGIQFAAAEEPTPPAGGRMVPVAFRPQAAEPADTEPTAAEPTAAEPTAGALATGDEHSELARREVRHDVYRMVIVGFRSPLISAAYIVAMVLLGLHLSHGASSIFQTLGLTTPKHRPWLFLVGPVLATLIVVGFVSIPLAILLDHWTGIGLFDA